MNMIHERMAKAPNVGELMIPGEKVAHVQLNNPLEHALLVLVRSGYSAVPVLDSSYKLAGLISKTMILNQVMGLERFEMERLSEIQVQEIMDNDLPNLTKEDTFLRGLKLVIDYPFVCIRDKEGYFDGILTRRAVLKRINREFYEALAEEKKDEA